MGQTATSPSLLSTIAGPIGKTKHRLLFRTPGPTRTRPTGTGPTGTGPTGTGLTGTRPTGTGPTGTGPTRTGPTGTGPTGTGPTRTGPTGTGPPDRTGVTSAEQRLTKKKNKNPRTLLEVFGT